MCLGLTKKGLRCKLSGTTNGYCYLHIPLKPIPQSHAKVDDNYNRVR